MVIKVIAHFRLHQPAENEKLRTILLDINQAISILLLITSRRRL